MNISETRTVWVAWTNSDLTEGRGYPYPLAVTASLETAIRLGKGKSVQGCNCDITEDIAVKINNRWYVPGLIINESIEDAANRKKREAKEAALMRKAEALLRAKELGLSDEDLKILSDKIKKRKM